MASALPKFSQFSWPRRGRSTLKAGGSKVAWVEHLVGEEPGGPAEQQTAPSRLKLKASAPVQARKGAAWWWRFVFIGLEQVDHVDCCGLKLCCSLSTLPRPLPVLTMTGNFDEIFS
jgi:hypothetical protein